MNTIRTIKSPAYQARLDRAFSEGYRGEGCRYDRQNERELWEEYQAGRVERQEKNRSL